MIWLTMLGSLFGFLLSGLWTGVTLGITGIIIMHFWGGGISLLGSTCIGAINIYALTAIPIFIFMGQIIVESGLAERIYNAVVPLLARFPGKLLHANVLLSAMFAAVLGVSVANAAVVGSVTIPELRKRKYDERLLLGTVCAAGTLGLLIPPSGALIMYGVMVEASIAGLFAAGTIPGVLLALLFMAFIGVKGRYTPSIAPVEEKGLPFLATLRSLLGLGPLVVIMFACIAPIYLGWATPSESAGIGALVSIVIGFIFGKLNSEGLKDSLVNTTMISSMLFFLVLGAMILSMSVSTIGLPRAVVLMIEGLPVSPVVILMSIYLMYIIMGCLIDGISMMVMTVPFIYPVIVDLGLDPLWFGVVLILVIEIGLVTPPVGLNLFVIQGIGGPGTKISDIFLGALPLLVITALVLGLITAFPGLTLAFPRFLGL